MECDICHRPANTRLPFNCTLCARDALYQPRLQLAETLLHKENLGKEVERNVTSPPKLNRIPNLASNKSSESNATWTVERAAAEQMSSEEKTQTIHDHVKNLRDEIRNVKIEIAERKARLQARRSEFASAKQELSQSQTAAIEPVEKGIRRTEHRWDTLHNKTAEARLFLCKEAALLYGLQQRKRKKGGLGRDSYLIGGVPIPDLRDLNNASPTHVTTSNTNLAHLVHLVSHYLSLRLPSEITLPHRDYPLPTIFSPSSSYTGREVSFPGFTPSQSLNNSPSASRHADQRPLPRPRPLHIDKKLTVLAKDDQLAYASFVEGITFLAWDIAWLCKTQGLNVGENSWEDVCAMGKNLWQLLLAPPPRPPISRELSSKSSPVKPPLSRRSTGTTRVAATANTKDGPPLGHFSHGTAYGYLASAAGADYMRDWRLQSAVKVIEKVKAMLLAERTGAEWELLEGNEWEEEEAEAEQKRIAEVIGKPEIEQTGILVKPENTENDIDRASGAEREEGKEASGWMKVKSR
ncbi:hypothetical protein P7C71_g2626, partial [Lecanoromycetidae sp. Uapishka_2]